MDEILDTPQAMDWGHRPYLDRDGKQALRPCDIQKKEIRITGTNGFVYAFVNFEDQHAGLHYLGRSVTPAPLPKSKVLPSECVLHHLRQRTDSTDSDSSDDSAPILIRHLNKKKKAEVLEKRCQIGIYNTNTTRTSKVNTVIAIDMMFQTSSGFGTAFAMLM